MNRGNKIFKASKFEQNQFLEVSDALTEEEALQIHINGKPFTITMRTPGADNELVRGLLFTEDVYTSLNPVSIVPLPVEKSQVYSAVNVRIPPESLNDSFFDRRSLLSVSSCGICGKKEIEDLKFDVPRMQDGFRFDIRQIPSLFAMMEKAQRTFNLTGGSHAASCFDGQSNLLAVKEDIGRHNAVDKVIGSMLIANILDRARIMLVSGRISYEIVSKSYKAGIPILAAVSAPSSFAVEYAERIGVSLLAFCRNHSATCYTHNHRILRTV